MDLVYRENVIERRKVLRYVSLFVFLVIVYAVGLPRYLSFVAADGKPGGPSSIHLSTSCRQLSGFAFCRLCHSLFWPATTRTGVPVRPQPSVRLHGPSSPQALWSSCTPTACSWSFFLSQPSLPQRRLLMRQDRRPVSFRQGWCQ